MAAWDKISLMRESTSITWTAYKNSQSAKILLTQFKLWQEHNHWCTPLPSQWAITPFSIASPEISRASKRPSRRTLTGDSLRESAANQPKWRALRLSISRGNPQRISILSRSKASSMTLMSYSSVKKICVPSHSYLKSNCFRAENLQMTIWELRTNSIPCPKLLQYREQEYHCLEWGRKLSNYWANKSQFIRISKSSHSPTSVNPPMRKW